MWESTRPIRDREIGNSRGSRTDLWENYIFKVWGKEWLSEVLEDVQASSYQEMVRSFLNMDLSNTPELLMINVAYFAVVLLVSVMTSSKIKH